LIGQAPLTLNRYWRWDSLGESYFSVSNDTITYPAAQCGFHLCLLTCISLNLKLTSAEPSLTEFRISDSIWLDRGSLAVAAGAQLYVFDKSLKELDMREQLQLDAHSYPLDNIFDVCQRLNGPLPVYHPQFLQQAILAGINSFVYLVKS
jgi:hypothetical protein